MRNSFVPPVDFRSLLLLWFASCLAVFPARLIVASDFCTLRTAGNCVSPSPTPESTQPSWVMPLTSAHRVSLFSLPSSPSIVFQENIDQRYFLYGARLWRRPVKWLKYHTSSLGDEFGKQVLILVFIESVNKCHLAKKCWEILIFSIWSLLFIMSMFKFSVSRGSSLGRL